VRDSFKLKDSLSRVRHESEAERINSQITLLESRIEKANADIAKFSEQSTSIMNLKEPLFRLKNPGIISIPLGFLMVILVSLLTSDKRSEALWEELHVRQNTGLDVEAASH
jgi:cation/acetate symporter